MEPSHATGPEDRKDVQPVPPAGTYYGAGVAYPAYPYGQPVSPLVAHLEVLRRRFWAFLATFVMVGTLGVVKAHMSPWVFEATARILIERQTPRIMKYEGVGQDYLGWDPGFFKTQSGKRVLLVDADLHRPKVHVLMNLDNGQGLSNVLIGEKRWPSAVKKVVHNGAEVVNLDVLTAGRRSPRPSELLGSAAMRALVREWREHYDWVFIDTPPILLVSDSSLLCALSDGVLLLVRAGKGHRRILQHVREHLTNLKAKVIGGILNGMVVSRVGRYYSYYYYRSYARYAPDQREGREEEHGGDAAAVTAKPQGGSLEPTRDGMGDDGTSAARSPTPSDPERSQPPAAHSAPVETRRASRDGGTVEDQLIGQL